MLGALSALCQGWDRPATRPAVTDNGLYVVFYEAAARVKSPCPSLSGFPR